MRAVPLLIAAALLVQARLGPAQPAERRDGTLVERAQCPGYVAPSYDDYAATAKKFYEGELSAASAEGIAMRTPLALATREEFARNAEASRRVLCTRLVYVSDGLKVAGLMWRPSDRGTAALPLIIFNRGGNRDFSRSRPGMRFTASPRKGSSCWRRSTGAWTAARGSRNSAAPTCMTSSTWCRWRGDLGASISTTSSCSAGRAGR